MSKELIDAVTRSTGLPAEQARAAVAAVLRHLAIRLPSPLFGELQSHLDLTSAVDAPPATDPVGGPAAPR
jgi:hypothetical protein